MTTAIRTPRLVRSAQVWALLLLPALLATRAAEPKAPSETVKLNPFVVSENDAVGYSANSTLAGTRINTALRDVGAAGSIGACNSTCATPGATPTTSP